MRERLELGHGDWRLAATFRRVDDRWEHRVEWQKGEQAWPLVVSREGTGDEPWPTSPPLQQLSVERDPAGRSVVLAVGMAGSSHWSLCVTTDADRRRLIWEVACRCLEPQHLGSQYVTHEPWIVEGDAAHLQLAEARISFRATSDSTAADPCGLSAAPGLLRFEPLLRPVAGRKTVRWKYFLEVDPARAGLS